MSFSPPVDETVQVECRAEYAYPQRPVSIRWEGTRMEVAEVLREWRTPEGKHYHVRLRGGRELLLAYREDCHCWQVRER